MIDILMNQPRELSFRLNIEGNTALTPTANFVVYGKKNMGITFRCDVVEGQAIVVLPVLSDFMNILEEGVARAKLEVVLDGNYFIPWTDQLILKNPIVVTADIDTSTAWVLPKEATEVTAQAPEIFSVPDDNIKPTPSIELHPDTFWEQEDKKAETQEVEPVTEQIIEDKDDKEEQIEPLQEEDSVSTTLDEDTNKEQNPPDASKDIAQESEQNGAKESIPNQKSKANSVEGFLDFDGAAGSFLDS